MWTSYQVLSGLIPVRKKITKILHSVLSCISPAQRKFINIVRRIKAEVWIPIYKNETSLYIYGLKPSYHRFMRSEEWSSSHTASNQINICLLLISAFSLLRGNLGILSKGENGNNIIIYAFNVFLKSRFLVTKEGIKWQYEGFFYSFEKCSEQVKGPCILS